MSTPRVHSRERQGGLEPKRARDERNPYKTSLKARAKSWGPTLSNDEFWLATIPLHSADRANAKRANARAGAEPALGKPKVFFGPDTPPLNIIGGYRAFAFPQITEALVFDRAPEHLADPVEGSRVQ
jgi:hypothetical protein